MVIFLHTGQCGRLVVVNHYEVMSSIYLPFLLPSGLALTMAWPFKYVTVL